MFPFQTLLTARWHTTDHDHELDDNRDDFIRIDGCCEITDSLTFDLIVEEMVKGLR